MAMVMGGALWTQAAAGDAAGNTPELDPVMQAAVDGAKQDLRHAHDSLGRGFVSRFLHNQRMPWTDLVGEEMRWRAFLQESRQFTDDGTPTGPLLTALAEQRRLNDRMRYLSCPPQIRAVNRQIRHLPVRMNGRDVQLRFGELIGTLPAVDGVPGRQIAIAALMPEFSRRVLYNDQVYFFGVMTALDETGETVAAGGDETVLCIWHNGRNIFNVSLGRNARIMEYHAGQDRLSVVCQIREPDGVRRLMRQIPYRMLMRLPLTNVPFAAAALCLEQEAK